MRIGTLEVLLVKAEGLNNSDFLVSGITVRAWRFAMVALVSVRQLEDKSSGRLLFWWARDYEGDIFFIIQRQWRASVTMETAGYFLRQCLFKQHCGWQGKEYMALQSLGANKMETAPLSGGMKNGIFWYSWKNREDEKPRKALARIHEEESVNVVFDPEYEIRAFVFISRLGHGPRLLASFPKGRIEVVANALRDLFIKCGRVKIASELLDEMPE